MITATLWLPCLTLLLTSGAAVMAATAPEFSARLEPVSGLSLVEASKTGQLTSPPGTIPSPPPASLSPGAVLPPVPLPTRVVSAMPVIPVPDSPNHPMPIGVPHPGTDYRLIVQEPTVEPAK